MPIINIALVLIIVGMLLWLVNTYVPMARSIKSILNAVVVIAVVVWVLKVSGVWPDLEQYRLLTNASLTRRCFNLWQSRGRAAGSFAPHVIFFGASRG